MTAPLTPAMPYAPNAPIPVASMNAYRVALPQLVDGVGGGTWISLTQIELGGAGLKLTGTTALELSATSICTQDAGGVFNFKGDVTLDGTDGHGSLTVIGGGSIEVSSGSILLDPSTGMLLTPGSFIKVGGTSGTPGLLELQNHSLLQADNGSTIDLLSGSLTKVELGATLAIYGIAAVENNGTIDCLSGGTIQAESGGLIRAKSGSTLQADAGSTVTLNGTTALGGATTQTSTFTKSGTGAYTVNRENLLVNLSGGVTLDGSQWDFISVNVVGGGAGTLTLSPPPHASGIMVEIAALKFDAAGTPTVQDQATGNTWTLGTGAGGGNAFQNSTGYLKLKSANIGGLWQWQEVLFIAGS